MINNIRIAQIFKLLILVLSLSSCNKTYEEKNFRFKFELNLGEDKGQSLGTLFQIENNGVVLCAAGFQNSYETYVGNNNRILSFFIKSDDPLKKESIGTPFSNKYRKIRLFNFNNRLYAKMIEHEGYFKYYDEQDMTWKIDTAITQSLGEGFRYAQVVNNNLLSFHNNYILYNKDTIYKAPYSSSYLTAAYRNGQFLLFNNALEGMQNTISLGNWSPKEDSIRILSTYLDSCPNQSANYPYCILDYKTGFLVGTNYGNIYYVDKDEIQIVFKRKLKDPSWQPYCMMSYFNEVVIGQYPTGNLFTYSGKLKPFNPMIIPPLKVSKNSREAQSIVLYCGTILTGIWPWGELHYFDVGNKTWNFAFRLFDYPKNEDVLRGLGRVEAPYIDTFKLKRNEIYNNTWGQRISGFVQLDESIYASTSNKGWRTTEKDVQLLGKEIVNQYGSIYKINKSGQIAKEIQWKPSTVLEFIYENNIMKIVQDDQVLISREFKGLFLDENASCVIGKGIYGEYDNLKIKRLKTQVNTD